MLLAFERRALLTIFFCVDRDLFPFAINVNYSKSPEGNQIDSGHEFSSECGQEFPVPPEQVYQHGCDRNIEHVISGRKFHRKGAARDRSGLQPLQLRERDRTCGTTTAM